MLHINHIAIATQSCYEAAARLRDETGLGFYDGGWSEAGTASKIVPLGAGTYLQISSLSNAHALADAANAGAKRIFAASADGDHFESLNLRTDSLDELGRLGSLHGMTTGHNDRAGRIRPDGERTATVGLMGGTPSPGMPAVYFFPEMQFHPSGRPVEPAYSLVRPLGPAWIEVGGTAEQMTTWLGGPVSDLPLRFNGKAPGIYALAVRIEGGSDVVLRRKASSES